MNFTILHVVYVVDVFNTKECRKDAHLHNKSSDLRQAEDTMKDDLEHLFQLILILHTSGDLR